MNCVNGKFVDLLWKWNGIKLQEIIDTLNDLFGAEVGDEDKLQFAEGIAKRIRRDEEVMAQIERHSEDEIMHGPGESDISFLASIEDISQTP